MRQPQDEEVQLFNQLLALQTETDRLIEKFSDFQSNQKLLPDKEAKVLAQELAQEFTWAVDKYEKAITRYSAFLEQKPLSPEEAYVVAEAHVEMTELFLMLSEMKHTTNQLLQCCGYPIAVGKL
jgi:hypothetical protein